MDRSRAARIMEIAVILLAGVGLSGIFACATPFAALAALTASRFSRRDTALVTALVWVANQVVGYGLLGYPWTWDSAGWGVAIGFSAVAAALIARWLSGQTTAPLAAILSFTAAFVMFEACLYIAGLALPGCDGAFAVPVVQHIFLVNAITFVALTSLLRVVTVFGRPGSGIGLLPAGASAG